MAIGRLIRNYPATVTAGIAAVVAVAVAVWVWTGSGIDEREAAGLSEAPAGEVRDDRVEAGGERGLEPWLSFPVVLAFVAAAALLTFGVAYVADRKIWQARRPGLTSDPTGLATQTRADDEDGQGRPNSAQCR